MRTSIFKNVTVTVLSDSGKRIEPGKLTTGNILLKSDDDIVVMPRDTRPRKHAAHNPLVYEGKFFSSRQKQNGNISLHGVINGETDLCEAYRLARHELDEFFNKLALLI